VLGWVAGVIADENVIGCGFYIDCVGFLSVMVMSWKLMGLSFSLSMMNVRLGVRLDTTLSASTNQISQNTC
jgi:hypothetical protein